MRRPNSVVSPIMARGSSGQTRSKGEDTETVEQRILRIRYDLQDLKDFHNIEISPRAQIRLDKILLR